MSEVTLVDYGLGNILAFAHIYECLNIPVNIGKSVSDIQRAKRLILPGVGAFDWAMERLNQSGFRHALDEAVLGNKTPVLGVCVGMQMMAVRSDEGHEAGLGWIDADVVRFDQAQLNNLPLPHMGWNDVEPRNRESLFEGIVQPRYYFLHSYHVVPRSDVDVLASASYAYSISAAIQNGKIFGTQFHPEKSHRWGIELLRNFARQ